MMAGIRGTDTRPELMLRRGLHASGFRFRLHGARLPGKPDIVLPRYRAVILAHGCFWHGHDCHLFRLPGTRQEFWEAKISRNRARDAEVARDLAALGWRRLTVWECALKGRTRIGLETVLARAAEWLRKGSPDMDVRGTDSA